MDHTLPTAEFINYQEARTESCRRAVTVMRSVLQLRRVCPLIGVLVPGYALYISSAFDFHRRVVSGNSSPRTEELSYQNLAAKKITPILP